MYFECKAPGADLAYARPIDPIEQCYCSCKFGRRLYERAMLLVQAVRDEHDVERIGGVAEHVIIALGIPHPAEGLVRHWLRH